MNHLPSDARSHPRGMDTSATPSFKAKKKKSQNVTPSILSPQT